MTHFGQVLLHHLRAVVDRQNDVCDARLCESLDLVQDHALVAEFHQWLGQCEGLSLSISICCSV